MTTIQNTHKQATGTSFYDDTIEASFIQLQVILGRPTLVYNYKVSREWVREFKGILFTVYDWKEKEFKDDEIIVWHIGGCNSESTSKVRQELKRLLKLL